MINKKLLLYKIAQAGKSVKEISDYIGINVSTFYRKVEKNTFKCSEVEKIASSIALNADELLGIFFAPTVA